ncbi:LLM class flavin-dependent oxidoreductase [Sphingomonas montanisoli]|uniref:LLM class flavin-dependent oxidoreductase n=1 Tax=Sphingomonas montanisoli TaxID=2606412 RepID=A0A5D9CEA7_9SPHN|nr:LLM class flavin-dependent oxidoreductase [Sphingomonas montanisoli]TZG29493.1 LLM class flavin-dependent oxidoreductase [Sphingomonas montanisoli]
MRFWHFTEQSYHPGWDKTTDPLRIVPPSSMMDREVVADLFHRYLDEYRLADELGFDIMVNEHHASMTCMSSVPAIPMAVLARETKKARLLCLGVPMANRMDPLRVAEELAMIDMISRGRLEFGFVKGSGWELYISNSNPARMMERFWEAHDLILKAWATRDGPFSWEGKHFHYRTVNVIPGIWQHPHPPMWMPGSSAMSAKIVAQKGYTLASFLCGHQAKATFAGYRKVYEETWGRECPLDRLAYLGMAVTADNQAEAEKRAHALYAYWSTVPRSPAGTFNPAGYAPVEANAQAYLSGPAKQMSMGLLPDGKPLPAKPTLDELAEAGLLFWGKPDQVVHQIQRFADQVGGLGHFLMMGQGGYLDHKDTADSLKLLAKEVYPAFKDSAPSPEPIAAE